MSELLSKKQLAERLGISEQTVDRYRKRGMPWKRLGVKLVRFEVGAVNAWLQEREDAHYTPVKEK
jgi:predicted DNA-binding transcriptional regulator AlpA